MSKQKTVKIRTFPGVTIGDMKFCIIPHLRKSLKSDSNIMDVFTHVEHHRDTARDLRTIRIKYPSNIIGHLNINSITNKFESKFELLSFLIGGIVDIILISETKIDGTFPTSQFLMSGYSNVYRLDQNSKGEGIMLFVKDNLIIFPVNGFCYSEKRHFSWN